MSKARRVNGGLILFAKLYEQHFCGCLIIFRKRSFKMTIADFEESKEKTLEALREEIDSLNSEELHELFLFYYRINHQHHNLITDDNFNKFLETFEKNPFKQNNDKAFKKQLADGLIEYTLDHMSLLTAVVLIKRKFTTAEIIENYYANVDFYNDTWY